MKTCKAPFCERGHKAKGYCNKHYIQVRHHGHLLRISYGESNEVVFEGDVARIFLYNRKSEKIGETVIDVEDYSKVKGFRWCNSRGYAVTRKGKTQYLHKMILEVGEGEEVDHVNQNPLDNRKSNLRPCTKAQNARNSNIRSNNTSGVWGVSWYKKSQKWRASITINREFIHLGCSS
jgi:hypothetical protein